MKINYQKQQEAIIEKLGEAPALLLHACCGPCSTHCLSILAQYFRVTVLWMNPNIHPAEEYYLRLENQKKVLERIKTKYPVSLLECPYEPQRFFEAVKGHEEDSEGGARCGLCFRLRLNETARIAKENGFDYFCTTLSVSPYKNAPLLNELGEEYAGIYGVKWLPADFKKNGGYLHSIEMSGEFGLYRQHYCGCVYSLNQSEQQRKTKENQGDKKQS